MEREEMEELQRRLEEKIQELFDRNPDNKVSIMVNSKSINNQLVFNVVPFFYEEEAELQNEPDKDIQSLLVLGDLKTGKITAHSTTDHYEKYAKELKKIFQEKIKEVRFKKIF